MENISQLTQAPHDALAEAVSRVINIDDEWTHTSLNTAVACSTYVFPNAVDNTNSNNSSLFFNLKGIIWPFNKDWFRPNKKWSRIRFKHYTRWWAKLDWEKGIFNENFCILFYISGANYSIKLARLFVKFFRKETWDKNK